MFEGLRDYLLTNLPKEIAKVKYSYETFGKEAEKPISKLVLKFLKQKKIAFTPIPAKDKNAFPDLEITIGSEKYAFEFKAGIHSNMISGKNYSSPANDMGTLSEYKNKIASYGANIYCIFVKYSVKEDGAITIETVYFDKIYTFIGKGKGFSNQLQYREKDGNLRPRTWKQLEGKKKFITTIDEFKAALEKTIPYRAKQIIGKKLDSLDLDDLIVIREEINERIDALSTTEEQ